jgi:hypothetical protein
MCKIFQRYPGELYGPSGSTADKIYENLRQVSQDPTFMPVDIADKVGSTSPVLVHVRKEPIKLVSSLFANPAGHATLNPGRLLDEHLQRKYNEMWTAERWEADQVWMCALFGSCYCCYCLCNTAFAGKGRGAPYRAGDVLVRQAELRQGGQANWAPGHPFIGYVMRVGMYIGESVSCN